MNRRDLLAYVVGASIVPAGRVALKTPLVCMRIETGGHVCADRWRVFNVDTGVEIGRDIPAVHWADKFAKAGIGQPFHFTTFRRDEKGRICFAGGHSVQDRRRGIIVQKT